MSEKKEYCLNCGNETHCGEILKRTEKGYVRRSKEYEIVV